MKTTRLTITKLQCIKLFCAFFSGTSCIHRGGKVSYPAAEKCPESLYTGNVPDRKCPYAKMSVPQEMTVTLWASKEATTTSPHHQLKSSPTSRPVSTTAALRVASDSKTLISSIFNGNHFHYSCAALHCAALRVANDSQRYR